MRFQLAKGGRLARLCGEMKLPERHYLSDNVARGPGVVEQQQLISDALRTELGVPTQASQAEQLKTLQSPAPGT
jgi:hypothetical protein